VPHERLADRTASAMDDVDDPGRQPRLDQQLNEALAERRRVGRRLENDRVPRDERGQHLPGGDRDREVPRRDHAHDADRHPDAHLELVAELRRGRLAEEPPALAAHVEAHVDCFLDVAAGLREHFPHLARHQLREVLLLVDQELPEPEQDLAALRGRDEPPLLERRLRGGDCALDVLGARERKGADRVAVGGARRLESLARRGVDPLAGDVVLVRLGTQERHRVGV
jgi:hypothetical protein